MTEPNNSIDNADRSSFNALRSRPTRVRDQVHRNDSDDFFQIQVRSRSSLDIRLNRLQADADLELLNARGRRVARSSRNRRSDDSIHKTVDAGTYYVRVFQARRNQDTRYRLSVTRNDEGAGNTQAESKIVEASEGRQVFSDYVGRSDRKDLYAVTLTRPTRFKAIATNLKDPIRFQLLDENFRRIFVSSTQEGERKSDRFKQDLEAGTYYIQIVRKGRESQTTYKLRTGFRFIDSEPNMDSVTIIDSDDEIEPDTMQVLSPNGHETLTPGNRYDISWTSNISGTISLDLYQNDAFLRQIQGSETNDGRFSWTVPTDLNPGNNYQIQISSTNDPSLRDDSDGYFAIAPVPIDLAANSFTLEQSSVAKGATINVNYGVQNHEIGNASDVQVGFYLSSDSTIESSDRLLARDTLSSLAGNHSMVGTQVLTLPATEDAFWTRTGTFYVGMIVDEADAILETNETNNANTGAGKSHSSLTITNPISIAQPDLVIQNPTAPTGAIAGDSITLSASTRNNGTTTSAASTTQFWLSDDMTRSNDDILLGTASIGSLAAGASESDSVSVTSSNTWGTGNKYILFQADSSGVVTESNEANNLVYQPISIQETPYLTVESPNGGDSLTAGRTYTVQWDDNISETVTLELLQNNFVERTIHASQASDGSFAWTIPVDLAGSGYQIKIASTTNSSISDSSDNTFTINPAPIDFQADAFDVLPTSLNRGETFTVDYQVSNQEVGKSPAFRVGFYLSSDNIITTDDRFLDYDRYYWLAGNSSVSASKELTLPDASDPIWTGTGTFYIGMIANYNSVVPDIDTSNNTRSEGVAIAHPQPDLVIHNPTAPTAAMVGDRITLGTGTRNTGTTASTASSTTFWLSNDTTLSNDDISLGFVPVGNLAAGASETRAISVIYNNDWGTGNKYILFEADSNDVVTESNEGNNLAYQAISIQEAPYLTVDYPNGGDSLTAGSTYTITWDDNISETVTLELLQNNLVERTIHASQASDGSFSWTIPVDLAGSGYQIKIASTTNSSISDISDNTFTINPAPIDLSADFFDVLPSSLSRGDTFTVNYRIKNNQAGDVPSFRVGIYLSTDSTITTDDRALAYTTLSNLSGNQTTPILERTMTLPSNTNSFWTHSGTFYIGMIVDDSEVVLESSEINNRLYEAIAITETPYITVNSPNTNLGLTTENTYTITWEDNLSENVRIDLYKGGSYSRNITTTTASDGNYLWTIPSDLAIGNDYQIRISSTTDATLFDDSDTAFSIDRAANNQFEIEFDYRYDTNGWFTAEKRAALEAAAGIWEAIIQDEFVNVPAGTNIRVTDPQTWTINKFPSDFEIDDLVVFVGALDMDYLGAAMGASTYPNGSELETRWTGDNFEPWVNSIAFDSNPTREWSFDPTPLISDIVPSDKYDFVSVAVHELGHVLGYSASQAFDNWVTTSSGKSYFTGPSVMAMNGGQPVPLTDDHHIQDGYGIYGEPAMDPNLAPGTRNWVTPLDAAFLDDIGYSIDYSQTYQNQNP